MPTYSKVSKDRLSTCDSDLITLLNEVIQVFNNTILYGYRNSTLQMTLFMKGREFIEGKWVIVNQKKVITYCDGKIKKSNHNYIPSKAVDVLPYPIDGEDVFRMYFFAGFVMATAQRLYREGKIKHEIRWGGDWDRDTEVKDQTFMDLAHFEIIEKS